MKTHSANDIKKAPALTGALSKILEEFYFRPMPSSGSAATGYQAQGKEAGKQSETRGFGNEREGFAGDTEIGRERVGV